MLLCRAATVLLSCLTLASSLQIATFSDRIEASNLFISVNLTSSGEFFYRSKSETLARLSGGGQPTIVVKLLQIVDNSYYTTSPTPVATINECRSSSSNFALNVLPWRLSTQPGPQGTTNLLAAATFGNNCTFTLKIILTDVRVSINVGPSTVVVLPDALKYTYDIFCPWERNIRSGQPPVPSDPTPIWVRNRRAFIKAGIVAYTFSNDSRTSGNAITAPVGYPTFQDWTSQTCTQSDMTTNSTPPLRPLWQGFDYSKTYSLITSYRDFNLTVDSLAWALSDNTTYTRASVTPGNYSQTYDGSKFILSLDLEAQFEFLERVEYDPTLALVFLLPVEQKTPEVSASPIQDISLSVGAIAAIVVVSIVAGVAVIIAIAAALIPSFRHKVMPFRARRIMETSNFDDSHDDADDSEGLSSSPKRDSQWVRATKY